MSKRSSGEEWSDDDTDGYTLNDSPPKRQKSCQQFERKESSESGFFSRTIKRFTSSVNHLFKGFSLSSDERHTSCDSVSNQSSVGMSQTDNSFSLNVSTGQQLIQSPMILTPLNTSHSSNYVFAVQQSTHETNQYITQSYIPIQIQFSNTSPNHLMVVSNTSSTMLSNGVTKCTHCGQISSSPKTSCGHCRLKPTPPKDNKQNTSSHGFPTQKFYTASGIQTISGIGRGRYRSESPKIQSLLENRELNRPRISDVRSQNNNRHVFQPLHQLNPNSVKKLNHELIELDAESAQSSTNHRTSQDTNDECIEIMDSNNTEEVIPAVEVQCDIKIDIKSDIYDEIKPKTIEQNSDNYKKESEVIVDNLDLISFPDYAMFGTYKTQPKTVDFTKDGIKLTNVSPNKKDTKFKYHIMIPFVEMEELLYCTDGTTNLLIVKPLYVSNLKIQESMYLGNESPNGLKFDIKSSDNREHYLIIVLKDKMGDKFLKNITQCSKNANESIKINPIGIGFGKHLLQRSKCQRENSSTVQIINNLKTPPNRSQHNPFSTDSNQKSRVYQSSDSSDNSPTPSKYMPKARRSLIRTPVPQIETIIVDDDEDGEEIITADNHLETEFDRVIFSYPEDDKNAIHLIGTDIKCLNRGEFLNDNIVNFFLSHFFNEKLDEGMRRRTHIFDTLFFMQLTEKRPTKRKSSIDREEPYSFETRYNQKLKKWTKDVDLFTKDFLIFPIIKESHWFLAIVCYPVAVYFLQSKCDKDLPIIDFEEGIAPKINEFEKKPCIIFMDSLGNASYKKSLSTPIREFLNLEWKAKYDCELMFKPAKYIRDYAPHVPNQTNSSDCGLFVLEYVEQFLKRPDDLVKKLFDNRKNALIDWFDNHSVKTKRQEIRSLILNKVSPELRDRLETLIDDTKLSDNEDFDEIGMEVMNHKSDEQSVSKDSSPEQEVL